MEDTINTKRTDQEFREGMFQCISLIHRIRLGLASFFSEEILIADEWLGSVLELRHGFAWHRFTVFDVEPLGRQSFPDEEFLKWYNSWDNFGEKFGSDPLKHGKSRLSSKRGERHVPNGVKVGEEVEDGRLSNSHSWVIAISLTFLVSVLREVNQGGRNLDLKLGFDNRCSLLVEISCGLLWDIIPGYLSLIHCQKWWTSLGQSRGPPFSPKKLPHRGRDLTNLGLFRVQWHYRMFKLMQFRNPCVEIGRRYIKSIPAYIKSHHPNLVVKSSDFHFEDLGLEKEENLLMNWKHIIPCLKRMRGFSIAKSGCTSEGRKWGKA
ncbi:hypothetical protein Tco_1430377 [Tanacetum coccineum]